MASTIKSGSVLSRLSMPKPINNTRAHSGSGGDPISTIFRAGSLGACSFGNRVRTGNNRKRLNQWRRQAQNSKQIVTSTRRSVEI